MRGVFSRKSSEGQAIPTYSHGTVESTDISGENDVIGGIVASSHGRGMSITSIAISALLAVVLAGCVVMVLTSAGPTAAALSAPAVSPQPSDSPEQASQPVPTTDPDRVSDQEGASPAPQETRPTPEIYLIERGDTLSRISGEVGVSVDRLVNINEIADPNLIYTDSALQVPRD